MKLPWKRYLLAFIITIALFLFAFLLSAQFSNNKVSQLREIQESIALDILSTETRFALLESSSCEHVVTSQDFDTSLSDELSRLARRLKFMESQFGGASQEVMLVKEQYSLLQIKDYLLVQKLAERCDQQVFSILYFHDDTCGECSRQSLVLDELHSEYPGLRIYWLDKDIRTPAMETLLSMFNITEAPTLLVNGKRVDGYATLVELREMVPEGVLSQEELKAQQEAAAAQALLEEVAEEVEE
jgi:hypothetical protein